MTLSSAAAKTVVRTYGRGSLLGFLSVAFSWLMARSGMRGWQESAAREMEDDTVAMAKRGYRVASSEELGYPGLGITWYRVTYELIEPPAT
jgi:hypothetical protein